MQSAAINKNTSLVFIDHIRKPNGKGVDPIDDMMNSTVKTATSDCILAIYKEGGKKGANLKGRGRDMEEIDLNLFWDVSTCCWQKDNQISEKDEEIINAMKALGGKNKADDINKIFNGNRGNTYTRLNKLLAGGKIQSEIIDKNIYYFLEDESPF